MPHSRNGNFSVFNRLWYKHMALVLCQTIKCHCKNVTWLLMCLKSPVTWIIWSTACSRQQQRKYQQTPHFLTLWGESTVWPVCSPHYWQVMQKAYPCHHVYKILGKLQPPVPVRWELMRVIHHLACICMRAACCVGQCDWLCPSDLTQVVRSMFNS